MDRKEHVKRLIVEMLGAVTEYERAEERRVKGLLESQLMQNGTWLGWDGTMKDVVPWEQWNRRIRRLQYEVDGRMVEVVQRLLGVLGEGVDIRPIGLERRVDDGE